MSNTFCPQCGQPNVAAARFCSACGAAIAIAQGPSFPPLPAQANVANAAPPPLDDRAGVPMPPRLHWALVLLFGLLSCGLFYVVWYFVHSSYAKKLDPKSNATLYMIVAVVCYLIYGVASATALSQNEMVLGVGLLAQLGFGLIGLVFFYCAYFSIAKSLERVLPKHGLRPWLGGITLFFFHVFYVQGQLSWIARWKDTGQTLPNPPKLVFWVLGFLLSVLLGIGVVLALFTAAYGDYAAKARAMVGQVEAQVQERVLIPDAATAEEAGTEASVPAWAMENEGQGDAAADAFDLRSAQQAAEAAMQAAAEAAWSPADSADLDADLPVYAASFSCANLSRLQSSEVEICQDAGLAAMDRELAQTWQMLQRAASAEQQAVFKREQLQWLRQRNACGTNRECIDAQIMSRQSALLEHLSALH